MHKGGGKNSKYIVLDGKKGFTLIEILIAMAILTIFIGSLFVVFKNSLEVWKKSEARLTVYQNARIVLEQMSREINCALVNDSTGIKFVGFASGSGKKSQKDEIYFTASFENSGQYDLCTIGYWLDEGDKELMHYLQRSMANNPLDFDFENLSSASIGNRSSQLGLNVTDLQFRFQYRNSSSSWAVTETAAWDSGADNITNYDSAGNLKNPDGLPNAVEIMMTVQDSANKEQRIFSTLVYIPQA